MPHCILEYSSNVLDQPGVRALLLDINHAIAGSCDIALADIKSRAIRHDDYAIADGAPDRTFVTLDIQILGGRSDAVKTAVSKAAHDVLLRAFPITAMESKASLTVQITDIHAPSYSRYRSYKP